MIGTYEKILEPNKAQTGEMVTTSGPSRSAACGGVCVATRPDRRGCVWGPCCSKKQGRVWAVRGGPARPKFGKIAIRLVFFLALGGRGKR